MVPPDLAEAASSESERRQATILFADISGFTSMSEKADPEQVTSVMNECFQKLGAVVERNGGVIDKFIGDCIMVLFGVPRALEDSPRRAVQTALEMREAVRSTGPVGGVEAALDVHIGINSGEVVSGEVGADQKREYTVMGDAVNLASRLKDAAPRGAIYVGSQTWRHTREQYEYLSLEPITVKGKEKTVAVYELLSAKQSDSRSRMVFSPLVGRQRELDIMELQVLKAINGEGSIVHVIGEAGIGKSRLMAELRNKECMQRVTLLEGRAQSFGKNLSFHPIIALLRNWAAIRDEDGEADAFRKLELAIRMASPDEAEEALPFIAALMGMTLSGKHAERLQGIFGETLTNLIFRNARDLLSRGAQRRPLVIVLEDIHWADLSTIEFIEYLFKMVEKDRVMFLNVFRAREEMEERLSRTAREGYGSRFVEIVLHPLDEQGCSELVRNLLKTTVVPSRAIASISARAGGNPFFIEEIVRAWIDEQAVEVRREGFQITDKIGSFIIPETVNEVIMSRFDRLDREARELLRVAAVIGRSFFYRILVLVAQGVRNIDERIVLLKEAQIILERSRTEEVEYLFKHALAQEAIYESILQQVRKGLHLSVAQAIESIFAGRLSEFAGMLALHYARGEDLDKAELYMVRAGEEALRSGASREAITYYHDALELYRKQRGEDADPAKVAMLERNIARALFHKGWYAEALPYYDRLLNYYGVHVPQGRFAEKLSAVIGLLRILVWLYLPAGRTRRPLTQELREGFELSLEKGRILTSYDQLSFAIHSCIVLRELLKYDVRDFETGLIILNGVSAIFLVPGISVALSRRVLEKLKPVIRPQLPRSFLFYLFVTLVHRYYAGEWEERNDFREPLVRTQLGLGNLWDIEHIFYTTCTMCIERGDWDTYHDALSMFEDALRRFPNDHGREYMLLLKSRFYLKRRMAAEMSSEVPELASLYATISYDISPALSLSARAALLREDFEAATKDLERAAESHPRSTGSVLADGNLLMGGAAVAVERARRAAVASALNRAARRECLEKLRRYLRNSRKFAPDLTESLKFLGSFWWHAGSRRRALEYWKQSIREGERLGARVELAHTLTEAGKLLGEMVPGPEWRNRGASLYTQLGFV